MDIRACIEDELAKQVLLLGELAPLEEALLAPLVAPLLADFFREGALD